MTLSRRTFSLATASILVCPSAKALGRIPYGGELSTAIPWSLSGVDPHELNDPIAAFLGPALFEPLFAFDSQNRPYPTLASSWPTSEGDQVVVRLRSLRWSNGARFIASDVAWSLERSRRLGARGLLAGWGRFEAPNATTLAVRGGSPEALMQALASPLCAVTSRAFHPARPVGCGPFRARFEGGRLLLTRNSYAARGPAFLDQIEVRSARDLADALRQFEAGQCNLGWFGRGLHEPRPGSRMVDAGHAGWVVLHSGQRAASWGRPGVVPSLLATLDPGVLERFGLSRSPSTAKAAAYGGPSCELFVRNDAAYLVELATTLASLLSTPSGNISVRPVSPQELATVKRERQFGFLLDHVRPLGPTAAQHQLSLLSEGNLARNPPRLPPSLGLEQVADFATRRLSLGVVGSLRLRLASLPEIQGLEQGNFGDVWWARPRAR